MMIKRCMVYLGMALAMCLGSFAVQLCAWLGLATATVFDQSYAVQSVKHELTLAQWRTGSEPSNTLIASNLIAISNHYGLTSAAPFGVPDWDMVTTI